MATCKKCIHQNKCFQNGKTRYYGEKVAADNVEQLCEWFISTADVAPKSEVDDLKYTLLGVMHSVDKWLDGDELKQDEVNRAATMREKTLRIIETLKSEVEKEIENWQELYADTVSRWEKAYEELEIKLENAKAEDAREILRDVKEMGRCADPNLEWVCLSFDELAEIEKKYTEEDDT